MTTKDEQIIGVLFPVPRKYLSRIFEDGKNVFVKYLARSPMKDVGVGKKIVFYESGGSKQIVGEATIKNIEYLTASDAVQKYGDSLFINKEELAQYTQSQPLRSPSKAMLVAVLKGVKKYPNPIHYTGPITMAGRYVTKSLFQSASKPNDT